MSVITHALCLMGGGALGVIVMACCAAAGRADRE